ncbi:hypothetical protein ACN28S_64815 [Cystobacter fuscus]
MMHFIHEVAGELQVARVTRQACELKEIADSEGVRPQVAPRGPPGADQAGALGEVLHESARVGNAMFRRVHAVRLP